MKKLLISLLVSLLLFLTAIIIYLVVLPCAIFHMILKLTFTKQYVKIIESFTYIFKSHAIGIDQIGNSAFHIFFNDVFIKDKTIHPFGKIDETISSVIGKNKIINNLRLEGKILDFIISIFDKNHSIKSIDN